MKKFTKLVSVVSLLAIGLSAYAQQTIGEGNLEFFIKNNGTILTPVLEERGGGPSVSYGFYNLAGEAINTDGSPRTSTAPIDQTEIAARIAAQYNSGNATITFPNPPL